MIKKILTYTTLLLSATAYADINTEDYIMKNIKLDTEIGKLSANLYLPEGIEQPPLVLVTGAWTTVKEQMPNNYAQELTKQGYAALTFDFRGWGESHDIIKYLEDPIRKTKDINAVINAAINLKEIDNSNIFGVGICASSGYMLDALSQNKYIKGAAVVAPWLHDKEMATNIYGGEDSFKNLLNISKESKNSYIEAASSTNENSLMYQAPYYTEKDRGLIPEYDNKFNLSSWNGWLNYDSQQSAALQTKPILFVASEAMALPQGAKKYIENSNIEIDSVWFDNVSQFDFYDNDKVVIDSVNEISKHFNKHLHLSNIEEDKAQIHSNINSFAVMADQKAFEYLGRLLSDKLLVDYSALFDNEPFVIKRENLMKQWSEFLPGFDTSFHRLSNVKIDIEDKQAIVSSDFSASHWLGNVFWNVTGKYSFTLHKNNGLWTISYIKVIPISEKGNRSILEQAPKFAKDNLLKNKSELVSY